jgi:hypothetical protein
MDRRIRIQIHTKMSWIRNTGFNKYFIAFDYGYFFMAYTAANMRAAQAVKCAAVLESMLPRESDFICI